MDLCLKLFPWAHFRRSKAGVKAHVVLDLRVGIPVFMRVSDAKTSDVSVLDHLAFAAGAFYVLDRGYVDFARLYRVRAAAAFFVTRAKRGMDFGVRRRLPVAAGGPVTHDQLIRLRGRRTRTFYPDTLRRIRYVDPTTGKRLTFLTNHLTLAAADVALLYRKRWRIELLFKWMKWRLRIRAFFGTSPAAVQAQLWVAVIVYVLVHRLKQRHGLTQTPNEIAQVLSVVVCEKTPVKPLFSELDERNAESGGHKQLSLFEF